MPKTPARHKEFAAPRETGDSDMAPSGQDVKPPGTRGGEFPDPQEVEKPRHADPVNATMDAGPDRMA